jgi:hypothetical protein
MFAPAKLGENRGSLFETCSRQCADKTHKENQGDLAGRQTLVIRFEGVGAGIKYNVRSDTKALFILFDSKGLFPVVRIALGCLPPFELPLFRKSLATNTPSPSQARCFPSSKYQPRSYPLIRKPPGPLPSDQEAKGFEPCKNSIQLRVVPRKPIRIFRPRMIHRFLNSCAAGRTALSRLPGIRDENHFSRRAAR